MLSFPATIKNDPARKGELATRKQFFGENRRYAVAPIHTRFDALEWFVWDAEHPLSDLNHAEVIRQAETLEEALTLADPFRRQSQFQWPFGCG